MDKSLFIKPKAKGSILQLIMECVAVIVTLIVISVFVGGCVSYGIFWWKNIIFVDKLDYKWALEEQYNNGKFFERICNNLKTNRREPLTDFQQDFCKRHNNYKDHPQALGE